ncbi:Zn-dependent peptidase ImmA (M78 family) [Humitalea rosea]|uniref:Zn-dependent peptidase ImmA (M78 family) n=2 Tax=Humitalea rosea TaxID=990373 RepID=A0A2W7JTE4_9PROT|nr:Zn-dependent peptidase ImmA (M78 family) [Humitalea rosea]
MTTCALSICVGSMPVWPVPGEPDAELEIQVDDFLAHLTEFWKPLMLRQVYPIDVNPLKPSDLRREAMKRWSERQPEIAEREEESVSAFEEAHDLARAFAGLFEVPPFWLFRSGLEMICETGRQLWRLPFDDVRSALSAIGDQICDRLEAADGARWAAAVGAWRERDRGDATGLLAWSIGLNRDLAGSLIADGTLAAPLDFEDVANDNDELRIAARMAGALPPDQIREIISLARSFQKHEAGSLRQVASACISHLTSLSDRRPFAEGEATARFVREWFGIADHHPLDIFAFAENLGIELRTLAAEPPTLDGLAVWGSRHGPGALLNTGSRRVLPNGTRDVRDSAGARVTLAHEICHLLLDGQNALSAVEVLKSRMPLRIEQRAKSFAGEILLPSKAAADAWYEAGKPRRHGEVGQLVSDLAERFQVTRSVAAWKLEHGLEHLDIDISATLDAVAPWR